MHNNIFASSFLAASTFIISSSQVQAQHLETVPTITPKQLPPVQEQLQVPVYSLPAQQLQAQPASPQAQSTQAGQSPTLNQLNQESESQREQMRLRARIETQVRLEQEAQRRRAEQRRFHQDHIKQTALIPIKLTAVASALVVGTPIAIARCEGRRMKLYGSAMSDEYDRNKGISPTMAASVVGQSMRAVGTVGEGVFAGISNAIERGWSEPFSRSSFSLEWIDAID